MICAICQRSSSVLYQCCSNDEHQFCESCCANMISSMITHSKIALLFNGRLPCYVCNGKLQFENLPKSIRDDLNAILSTIPKTSKHPETIQEFGYNYNQSKQLRHCLTNKKFVFLTQRHYELLGKAVEIHIQSAIKDYPWKYEEVWLPLENCHEQNAEVNIFLSNDFRTNFHGCLVLIQGCGVVRAGQWSRSCCINESLDIGAMFPYMSKAKELNLSVVILNPNQTHFIDESNSESNSSEDLRSFYLSSEPLPQLPTKPIPDLSTGHEHILYVYDHVIAKLSPAKQLFFVAHSAGGDQLMHLLRQRQDSLLPKLSKIAFIDSIHFLIPSDANKLRNFLQSNAIHFVASDQPAGQPIHRSENPICSEVSAGHGKHEYTSGFCLNQVFEYFR